MEGKGLRYEGGSRESSMIGKDFELKKEMEKKIWAFLFVRIWEMGFEKKGGVKRAKGGETRGIRKG